jgi:hypothetical protein
MEPFFTGVPHHVRGIDSCVLAISSSGFSPKSYVFWALPVQGGLGVFRDDSQVGAALLENIEEVNKRALR